MGWKFVRTICVIVLFSGFLGGADAPPEFEEVDGNGSQVDFENALVAINCGDATYEVRGVTFHAWNDPALSDFGTISAANITGPSWNGSWPNIFVDPDLEQLAEVYQSIAYMNAPMWIEFSGLNPDGEYKVQFLMTANALNNWDHGGSIKVTGEEETIVASNFHLNSFAMGIPFVVTAEGIVPSADGIIRIEYFREADWTPSPALDPNWIWQGIILTGPPIVFPTDLKVVNKDQALQLSWVNHEPSSNGTPYDEIEIIADGTVRAVLGEGGATIDENSDNSYSLDLTDPANSDLTAGKHTLQIRTNLGGYKSKLSTSFGFVPIRIAVGNYVDYSGTLETSDGRIWSSDDNIFKGNPIPVDWQANVDSVLGIAGAEEFGLDPMDPVDQLLFSRFRYDPTVYNLKNHMEADISMPNGSYDVFLYFWEYASPWIFDRTAEVSVEGGPPTFIAYGDEDGTYAANPNEAWRLVFESVQVADGVLSIDMLPGWNINGDVTLSAIEVLSADPAPKSPRNLQVTTTGDGLYNLSWEIPGDADYSNLNILSRMSGQKVTLEDPTVTSFVFEQEIPYESTDNEAFVLQARSGNTFYSQLQAGAGVPPMYINAGGAGDVNNNIFNGNSLDARDITWVSDLSYVDERHDFVAPLLSGDRNYVTWNLQPFQVLPGSPADELDPPFVTPDNLEGDELTLMQEIRWTWSFPTRDPIFMPMLWQIPINDGTYFVRLYFGEGFVPAPPAEPVYRAAVVTAENSDPKRIYYHGIAPDDTVPVGIESIEGGLGVVAVMEFDNVAVDDGFLTLVFDSFCSFKEPYDNNPTVSAIEVLESSEPPPETFKRGDVNGDDQVNLADAISLLSHLFAGLPAPLCPDSADSNDDGALNLADAIKILGYLFAGTGPLPDPFEVCGPDSQEDSLGPCDYPPCQ